MSTSPETEPPSIRQRYRAQVRREVKEAALEQLARGGPAALSISAIGKQLGASGPALYRYFTSRDELLTELVIDAYHDLAEALGDAAGRAGAQDARGRLLALSRAYRSWGLGQPHRYRLLFGPPLPGYQAHAKRLVEASWASMEVLLGVLDGVGGRPGDAVPEPLASQLVAWAHPHHPGSDPAIALRAIHIWSRMHGIVGLEIAGNFASMGLDADQVFETELAAMAG